MKRLTIVAGGAATAVLAGTLLAVPALADRGSSSGPGSTIAAGPLTAAEKDAVDGFLDDHLRFAHALAARAQAWAAFMKAHPDIAAEVAKVKALPVDQRRAEIRQWLSDHPDARKAIRDWRVDRRTERTDRRQRLRTQREQRRGTAGAAGATSPSV
jgi:hemophore-related protein